ncbi:NAD-dependent epimerase/dehydratase family protein [Streptomyces sp. NPDC050433]|uniref:NAD-dependent epimerase/dehydratase family protein n=1 Tax=Streptomyces sp. NPDC050433 TaxID=3365615 RepID=UPI0037990C7F
MTADRGKKSTHLVTGAGGFFASHLVKRLVAEEYSVLAWDVVPWEEASRLHDLPAAQLHYEQIDVGDASSVARHFPTGTDVVWHFAANADIPAGATQTALDVRHGLAPTQQILEAMRKSKGTRLVFPSSSAVYGIEEPHRRSEVDGPFLPVSLYGAAKVGCEALISAYCHCFGLSAVILRFGNLLGGSMRRGILHDFIAKLRENDAELTVLGSGQQRKSYVLVDDCVDASWLLSQHRAGRAGCEVYNVAAGGTLSVLQIAELVTSEMGLVGVPVRPAGDGTSWVGDQPVIDLDITKLLALGWRPRHSPEQAVRVATRRLLEQGGSS